MGSWTLHICEKHGAFIPRSERDEEIAAHCQGPSRAVEVIDRKPADDLAEAVDKHRAEAAHGLTANMDWADEQLEVALRRFHEATSPDRSTEGE